MCGGVTGQGLKECYAAVASPLAVTQDCLVLNVLTTTIRELSSTVKVQDVSKFMVL